MSKYPHATVKVKEEWNEKIKQLAAELLRKHEKPKVIRETIRRQYGILVPIDKISSWKHKPKARK